MKITESDLAVFAFLIGMLAGLLLSIAAYHDWRPPLPRSDRWVECRERP